MDLFARILLKHAYEFVYEYLVRTYNFKLRNPGVFVNCDLHDVDLDSEHGVEADVDLAICSNLADRYWHVQLQTICRIKTDQRPEANHLVDAEV